LIRDHRRKSALDQLFISENPCHQRLSAVRFGQLLIANCHLLSTGRIVEKIAPSFRQFVEEVIAAR
jgi:hypothetical protein